MKICQVERPLVATNRIPGLEHKYLQVVRDGSSSAVAVDARVVLEENALGKR